MKLEETQIKFIRVVCRRTEFINGWVLDKHLRVLSKIINKDGDVYNTEINGYDRIILSEIRSNWIKYLYHKNNQ